MTVEQSLLQVKLRLEEEEERKEEEGEFDVSDFLPDLTKLWNVVSLSLVSCHRLAMSRVLLFSNSVCHHLRVLFFSVSASHSLICISFLLLYSHSFLPLFYGLSSLSDFFSSQPYLHLHFPFPLSHLCSSGACFGVTFWRGSY